MMETYIIYGIHFSLIGMVLAALIALTKNSFKASNAVLFFSTLVGFFVGLGYLINFSGQEIVLAEFSSLFNATFTLNFLSGIFFTLVTGISSLVVVYGVEYLRRYQKIYAIENVQFLISLFVLGMTGVLMAGNVMLFMIFWEMMSVASFFLVMSDRTKESARAAFIYFVMTHLGAAAILGGFLILSQGSLAFNLNELTVAAKNLNPTLLSVAFLLFLFGFGSKAGLIPFHIWLPVAHPQAPTNVSALMSGLMLKIAVYGFLRIMLAVMVVPSWLAILVITLGIVSAIFGALYAAIARDIKRAFAYSSIENMGIIFTILGVALYVIGKSETKEVPLIAILLITYAIFHAINHAIFKTGLFLSSGVIISKIHSKSLEVMGGLAKAMPFFSFVFLIIILSSAALPPMGAFYGEWGFVHALIDLLRDSDANTATQAMLLIVLPLFALVSGLAIFAMVKIFSISMLGLPRTKWHEESGKKNDVPMVAPIAVLGGMMILFGIFAKNILGILANRISHSLFDQTDTLQKFAIYSEKVFAIFVIFLLLAFVLYKLFAKNGGKEREYQTWDCGQPIDASMEYTATAFSAPIRFFFLPLVQRSKEIVSVPVVDTNPWIAKKSFSLVISSAWQEKFYKPSSRIVFWLAEKIRLVHTGRIQYYLLLILITIVITLMIVL